MDVPPLTSPSIAVTTIGKMGNLVPKIVAANIQGILNVPVDILPSTSLPDESYLKDRKQYDAGIILRHLENGSFPHRCILGLTGVDLCVPVFTYVFGEAHLGGRAAIVSIARLQRGERGETIPEALFYERIVKVALHEIGHVFSLYHCGDERCLMRFSPRIEILDRLPLLFCDRCLFLVRRFITVSG